MGPWELPLRPSSPTPPSSPGLSFSSPPSSLSLLSPSPSWSLPVSPSLCFFHFRNLDHFPGCLLPSSPSTDGRPLPPPLSLRFLRFLLFPPYNVEQMSLFLWIFLVPPAALELRSLSSSAWACLDSFVSYPLARSHFRVLSSPVSPAPPPAFQVLGALYSSTSSLTLRVSLPPSDDGVDGAEPGSFSGWCCCSVPQQSPTRVS